MLPQGLCSVCSALLPLLFSQVSFVPPSLHPELPFRVTSSERPSRPLLERTSTLPWALTLLPHSIFLLASYPQLCDCLINALISPRGLKLPIRLHPGGSGSLSLCLDQGLVHSRSYKCLWHEGITDGLVSSVFFSSFSAVLGMEPRASFVPGRRSTTELHPGPGS